MAGLPHFRNSASAVNHWEPVFKSMFEVTLFPPSGGHPLLIEQVKTVGGLGDLNPSVAIAEQNYKQATRSYAANPEKTTLDLTITFELNLDDANENFVYTTMRKWWDLRWNPLTGTSAMKRQYVGSGVIVQYNRDGSIYRRIDLQEMIPMGQLQDGLGDLDYKSNDCAVLTAQFRCDCWDEQTIGLAR